MMTMTTEIKEALSNYVHKQPNWQSAFLQMKQQAEMHNLTITEYFEQTRPDLGKPKAIVQPTIVEPEPTSFQCPYCNRPPYQKKHYLDKHIATRHGDES